MGFKEASDVLTAGISHQEVAGACGVSVATIRQARLRSDAAAHRRPPPNWRRALARLARKRGGELVALAEVLEREEAEGLP